MLGSTEGVTNMLELEGHRHVREKTGKVFVVRVMYTASVGNLLADTVTLSAGSHCADRAFSPG